MNESDKAQTQAIREAVTRSILPVFEKLIPTIDKIEKATHVVKYYSDLFGDRIDDVPVSKILAADTQRFQQQHQTLNNNRKVLTEPQKTNVSQDVSRGTEIVSRHKKKIIPAIMREILDEHNEKYNMKRSRKFFRDAIAAAGIEPIEHRSDKLGHLWDKIPCLCALAAREESK